MFDRLPQFLGRVPHPWFGRVGLGFLLSETQN